MKPNFLTHLTKSVSANCGGVASDGTIADVTGYVDTGSYMLNALLSGSIYGGLPDNKITALAGETSTGKTYFTLDMAKYFLATHAKGIMVIFDSESAITKNMLESRGIDTTRVMVYNVATVEEFRTLVSNVLTQYMEQKATDRHPMLFVLDSLGMLSSQKEMTDIEEGNAKADFTRAKMIRGTFRALTIKLGQAKVPMVVTNHTYEEIGKMYAQSKMGGGNGLYYAASTIVFLRKRKDKVGTEVVGNFINCTQRKGRLTQENRSIDVRLSYEHGLDRYYGLLDLALAYDIIKKVNTRYEINGVKVFGSKVYKDPEKYFTPELLQQIDIAAGKEFKYGTTEDAEAEDADVDGMDD